MKAGRSPILKRVGLVLYSIILDFITFPNGDHMKEYDVIVIGAGVGTSVAFKALAAGMKVALVAKGNPGGTCLNTG